MRNQLYLYAHGRLSQQSSHPKTFRARLAPALPLSAFAFVFAFVRYADTLLCYTSYTQMLGVSCSWLGGSIRLYCFYLCFCFCFWLCVCFCSVTFLPRKQIVFTIVIVHFIFKSFVVVFITIFTFFFIFTIFLFTTFINCTSITHFIK